MASHPPAGTVLSLSDSDGMGMAIGTSPAAGSRPRTYWMDTPVGRTPVSRRHGSEIERNRFVDFDQTRRQLSGENYPLVVAHVAARFPIPPPHNSVGVDICRVVRVVSFVGDAAHWLVIFFRPVGAVQLKRDGPVAYQVRDTICVGPYVQRGLLFVLRHPERVRRRATPGGLGWRVSDNRLLTS
jgi:hypothetical protein